MLIKIIILNLTLLSQSSFSRGFSMVTSGGVSLGAYEAGYLYQLVKNRNKDKDDLRKVVTGASAGAINSFITILEYCSIEKKSLKESLFWKGWIPTSYEKLSNTDNLDGTSIFSRSSFEPLFLELEGAWKRGLREGCKFSLGFSLTRKNPLRFFKNNILPYPRSTEVVVVEITGRGKGQEPLIKNIEVSRSGVNLKLPFKSKKWTSFQLLKNALLGSSSFPLAFAPTIVPHCLSESKGQLCEEKNIRMDKFIDGGVFNNGPLDLAHKISSLNSKNQISAYIYMDPEFKDFPVFKSNTSEHHEPSLLREAAKFVRNFVSSSRTSQVSSFLSNHPKLSKKVRTTTSSFPLASEVLVNFFGFFEEDFRVYDFYAGMQDADLLSQKKFNVLNIEKLEDTDLKLYCLKAISFGEVPIIEQCRIHLSKDSNFKALMLLSIDRLMLNCSQFEEAVDTPNHLCSLAMKKTNPDDLFEKWPKGYLKKRKESDLSYVMRRLGEHGFRFKDLKINPGEEKLAFIRLKEKLNKTLKKVGETQPDSHQMLFNKFTPPMLNFLGYSPVPVEKSIMLGTNSLAFGYSKVFSEKSKLGLYSRYGYGLMISGLDYALYEKDFALGFTPYVGLYGEVPILSNAALQLRIGARFGYQFSTYQRFSTHECDIDPKRRIEFPRCSHFVNQAVIDLSILDSLKLEFVYQIAPFVKEISKKPDYMSLLIGWQF